MLFRLTGALYIQDNRSGINSITDYLKSIYVHHYCNIYYYCYLLIIILITFIKSYSQTGCSFDGNSAMLWCNVPILIGSLLYATFNSNLLEQVAKLVFIFPV